MFHLFVVIQIVFSCESFVAIIAFKLIYCLSTFCFIEIEKEVSKLLLDDDVSDSGIYPYIITGEEKHLNIRAFTLSMKLKVHEIQKGKCKNSKCNVKGDLENFEFDHIVPWSKNGRTEIDNCQMLCIKHHKELKNR